MESVVDLDALHKELNLSDKQKDLLCDAFEKLMAKYKSFGNGPYFAGNVDGMNNCWKVIKGINDDYNGKEI